MLSPALDRNGLIVAATPGVDRSVGRPWSHLRIHPFSGTAIDASQVLGLTGPMPRFTGIHHLALTVRDLTASVAFYEQVFSAPPAAQLDGEDLRRELFALPGGTNLGLTEHAPTATGTFTPFQPGLDHLGFAVDSREELELWSEHLTGLGIAHSGIIDVSYGSALSFTDPDEIALEFFTPRDAG